LLLVHGAEEGGSLGVQQVARILLNGDDITLILSFFALFNRLTLRFGSLQVSQKHHKVFSEEVNEAVEPVEGALQGDSLTVVTFKEEVGEFLDDFFI